MTLLELKARFGELAIEEIKTKQHMQRIMQEQQKTLDAIVEAEKSKTLPTPNIESPPEA